MQFNTLTRLLAPVLFALSASSAFSQSGYTFQLTGSMNVSRVGHTASLLSNGLVLVTGGSTFGGVALNSAELYNPATGTWRFTPTPMSTTRYGHTATLLPNGKVLIAAGINIANTPLSSAEIFDPVSESFSPAAPLNVARFLHSAAALPDGRVMIFGGNYAPSCYGCELNSTEIFDPNLGLGGFGLWSMAAPMPASRTQSPRIAASGGNIFLSGGQTALDPASRRIDKYNPITNFWSTFVPMLVGRSNHTSTVLADGTILLVGGNSFDFDASGCTHLTSVERYDPGVSPSGQSAFTASISFARRAHTATLLPSGNVLVIGGQTCAGDVLTAELYSAATNSWISGGTLNFGRALPTTTLLPNGRVLVVGGVNAAISGAPLASAEVWALSDSLGPISSNLQIDPSPLPVSASANLSAFIDDSTTGGGTIASANYTVDVSASSPMNLTTPGAVATAATAVIPSFSQAGVFNVCVNGVDSNGNAGEDLCILLPVYDPNGGFVTGGGQVNSPAGADANDPAASGHASFGFVSKYLPGKSTPSGNLQFQFKNGNLNFKSTSMEWLVVTGEPRAMFRGLGLVNDTTLCRFEVDAWDASFGNGVDAFGLKLYACGPNSNQNRYTLSPTPISKGSIIIHR